MNDVKIVALAAAFTMLTFSAAPAHAQARSYRGHSGFGVSRGPVRIVSGPRASVGARVIARPVVVGSPFYGSGYVVRPPVRVGYGISTGYPLAFVAAAPYPYPYPYTSPYRYPAPSLAFGPVRSDRIPGSSSLAIIGRIAGSRVTRGAVRLAFRLLIP